MHAVHRQRISDFPGPFGMGRRLRPNEYRQRSKEIEFQEDSHVIYSFATRKFPGSPCNYCQPLQAKRIPEAPQVVKCAYAMPAAAMDTLSSPAQASPTRTLLSTTPVRVLTGRYALCIILFQFFACFARIVTHAVSIVFVDAHSARPVCRTLHKSLSTAFFELSGLKHSGKVRVELCFRMNDL